VENLNTKEKAAIAKKWDLAYKGGGREMYRILNPARFVRLTKRLPLAYIFKKGLIQKGSSVLEVGCGGGQYGIAFALCGCRTTLLDYSIETLQIVEKNIATAKKIRPAIDLRIVQGDMFKLGFSSTCFDMVFNEGALEHFASSKERIRCIAEMARVTKAGGHVLIMIPNNFHPLVAYWKKHDFPWLQESNPLREYLISPEMLTEEMMAAGLKSVYVDGYEVYDGIQKWPKSKIRIFVARALKLILPEPPRNLRVRYGTYLFALGTV